VCELISELLALCRLCHSRRGRGRRRRRLLLPPALRKQLIQNRNSSYAVGAFTLFVMIVGVWLMLISYTDLAQLKTGKGKDDGIFGAGCALIFLSIILLIIAPNFEAYRSYKKQDGNENGTLSLILSGEYYTAFSSMDCLFILLGVGMFVLLMGIFISSVMTKHYALPFLFLQILPVYGFIINAVQAYTSPVPNVASWYNMLLMLVLCVCILLSMFHVCAIPGVTTICHAKLSHTSNAINWGLSLPWLLLLAMTSLGLVNATYVPSFMIDRSCVEDQMESDKDYDARMKKQYCTTGI
jgi:hypothetical protein